MNINKFLAWGWGILAVVNLVTYIIDGFADFDKVHIAMLQSLVALYNYKEAKKGA